MKDKDRKRHRPHIKPTRLSDAELADMQAMFDRTGKSFGAQFREARFGTKDPSSPKMPSADRQEIARCVAALGQTAQSHRDLIENLRSAQVSGDHPIFAEIEAAQRALIDLCAEAKQALGVRR